ncbi:site-specific integrase [Luteipulveratus halotolerans]|uniref:DNA topoisomerase I catalytic core eukaryotic-type domain-containing protein n=1 Tax=Luteipulveratus halotolerans TaxID=1631356 RepID=A0A0L6CM23_9MICO|nr:hypothetical protein [Luteipulveratus halotolerans]KNX38685.1 hypothetical protein VV01_18520 [Luteipulveratus halotolerans]
MRFREVDGVHDVTADLVSTRFEHLVGPEFTVKDLRTWAATVTAAQSLARSGVRTDESDAADAAIRDAVRAAADSLGDTEAVARDSYVDPRVLEAYRQGRTVRPTCDRSGAMSSAVRRRVERELIALLAGG